MPGSADRVTPPHGSANGTGRSGGSGLGRFRVRSHAVTVEVTTGVVMSMTTSSVGAFQRKSSRISFPM